MLDIVSIMSNIVSNMDIIPPSLIARLMGLIYSAPAVARGARPLGRITRLAGGAVASSGVGAYSGIASRFTPKSLHFYSKLEAI